MSQLTKVRRCLKCGDPFRSPSSSRRLCKSCRDEWYRTASPGITGEFPMTLRLRSEVDYD